MLAGSDEARCGVCIEAGGVALRGRRPSCPCCPPMFSGGFCLSVFVTIAAGMETAGFSFRFVAGAGVDVAGVGVASPAGAAA
jgi:hypothetical protein